MIKQYNIRVYGILLNHKKEVLVSDEYRMGMYMTKFPGGGLEKGEGLLDALKREWKEELNAEIEVVSHFYTTDFYVKPAFNNSQLLSVYYLVNLISSPEIPISQKQFNFEESEGAQSFRWIAVQKLEENNFTFPIDKRVALLLKNLN
mgnify:CR=1 FL=1